MKINTLTEKLVRKLTVRFNSYCTDPEKKQNWLEGYFAAIEDTQSYLRLLEIYEPYEDD